MSFTFKGAEYEYIHNGYNNAHRNMRTVEVPIAYRYRVLIEQ